MRAPLLLLLCSFAAFPAAGQTTINLSHDLVRYGIASQNLDPNTPVLDAQPLFLATLQYIQNNPAVTLLTADPGSYYFLTPLAANSGVYLYFPPLSHLTIDFQGSTLYFKDGYRRAFDIELCHGLTLKNFTIDYLVPSYTQVQLTAIDPAQSTFTYEVTPGWANPNTFVTTSEFGGPQLIGAFFRNGVQVPATALTFFNYPITGNTLKVQSSDVAPWTQSDVLSTLRPGDAVAVANTSGAEPIAVSESDSMLFSNIEIHGGLGAINVFYSSNTTLENIRVVPRPGGALLGSVGGGLGFFSPLENNHIRNSYIRGTMDDALAMGEDPRAIVVSQPGPRQLVATRNGSVHIPSGTLVNFVPLSTGAEEEGGIVVSQDPPDSPDQGGQIQVTFKFDRDLPALAVNDQMVAGSPGDRGGGSTIEDNIVDGLPYGRGIYLSGLESVLVQRNVIRGTSSAGIELSQIAYLPAGQSGLPSHHVTIRSNSVENVLGPQASGTGGISASTAGIVVNSLDQSFNYFPQPVNTDVFILDNFVGGSGRAGIWVGELNGGMVIDNVIVNWNQYPGLAPEGGNPFPGDFAQPLVERFSSNMATTTDVIDANSPLEHPVTLYPPSISAPPDGESGSFGVTVNVPNFNWNAWSDSSWLTVTGRAQATSDGVVQYAAAPNTTAASRTGSITVAGVAFSVTQAGRPGS